MPNDLWQMDFLGHVALGSGRVHPLCVLDDHSRYAVGVFACPNEQDGTVRTHLANVFRRYGLPQAILADNSSPWGVTHSFGALTKLGAWLVRLGVEVWHGRPHHPQTQGKVERFHQTVAAEILSPFQYPDLSRCQVALDAWRQTYNLVRPHAALGLAVPASRYHASPRPFPETLPPIVYGPDDVVRTVHGGGQIQLHGRHYFVGHGVYGQPVALRPTADDGVLDVYYCQQRITTLDLRTATTAAID
jgi:transposase InsO family protein